MVFFSAQEKLQLGFEVASRLCPPSRFEVVGAVGAILSDLLAQKRNAEARKDSRILLGVVLRPETLAKDIVGLRGISPVGTNDVSKMCNIPRGRRRSRLI